MWCTTIAVLYFLSCRFLFPIVHSKCRHLSNRHLFCVQGRSTTLCTVFSKQFNNFCKSKINMNFHGTLMHLKKDSTFKVCGYDERKGIMIMAGLLRVLGSLYVNIVTFGLILRTTQTIRFIHRLSIVSMLQRTLL